jgi:LmbE family N-acetylglucosaminyl deacetylase
VVAVPYGVDRHPDHVVASQLLTEAVFNAGLRRYRYADGEAWKVQWVCYYFINDTAPPSFLVDVTDSYEVKRRALDCHASQFTPPSGADVSTRLNTPLFRQMIESRDAQFGALAGVRWAEGFVVREPLLRDGLLRWP